VSPPIPDTLLRARVEWEAAAESLRTVVDAPSRPLLRALLLQRWLHVNDEILLVELADRLSLRQFCGLSPSDRVPGVAELRAARDRLGVQGEALLRRVEAGWSATDRPLLSVVSPVYGAERLVGEFVRQVMVAAERLTPRFELVLVEDGSPDRSWEEIAAACRRDHRVKGLRLSRNFGQHRAITAGLAHARGDWVAVMDCDLQDDPADLARLLEKGQEGHDIVFTVKGRRRHGWLKNLGARVFSGLFNQLTDGPRSSAQIGSFSLLNRRALDAFLRIGDVHRHYLMVLRWLGFRAAYVPVEHLARPSGRSSYGPRRLLRHALDGLTSQSDRLLWLALSASFAFLASSLGGVVFLVVSYLRSGFKEGWTSTVVLILLGTGAVLFSVGVVGIYVGKIFDQVRPRPLYLVQESANCDPQG
jgi:dolichol-phosphate mannosyltransferase